MTRGTQLIMNPSNNDHWVRLCADRACGLWRLFALACLCPVRLLAVEHQKVGVSVAHDAKLSIAKIAAQQGAGLMRTERRHRQELEGQVDAEIARLAAAPLSALQTGAAAADGTDEDAAAYVLHEPKAVASRHVGDQMVAARSAR